MEENPNLPLAFLGAVVAFVGAWVYCALHYGFLLGLGLGWIPAGVLALLVMGVMAVAGRAIVLLALAGGALAIIFFGFLLAGIVNPRPQPEPAQTAYTPMPGESGMPTPEQVLAGAEQATARR